MSDCKSVECSSCLMEQSYSCDGKLGGLRGGEFCLNEIARCGVLLACSSAY